MTVREALQRWLGHGRVSENSDELVEVAIIPLVTGPLSIELLCAAGFHASGAPTFNVVTNVASDYRILVPRKEAATAITAVLAHRRLCCSTAMRIVSERLGGEASDPAPSLIPSIKPSADAGVPSGDVNRRGSNDERSRAQDPTSDSPHRCRGHLASTNPRPQPTRTLTQVCQPLTSQWRRPFVAYQLAQFA